MRPDDIAPDETLERLVRLEEKIDQFIEQFHDVLGKVETLTTNAAPYVDQVGPMIEQLENSTLFKMMIGKKKS